MRYILTGATSFLGREMVDLLLSKGEEVVAICRPKSLSVNRFPSCVSIVLSEMSEYGNLHEKIENADVFINLAWMGTSHDGRDIAEVQQENVKYTLEAMKAAKAMGCRLFVGAGSQAEYGEMKTPQSEVSICRPFSEYGKAKLQAALECCRQSERLGIKYLHLRIFSLFGEEDHPWTLVMDSLDKMLAGDKIALSDCMQNWNYLYVKDAARQIVILCEHALKTKQYRHEIYNIASNDTRLLKEYVEEMKRITGSESELDYGAVAVQKMVSLQPDMSKTSQIVQPLAQYEFGQVIGQILNKKRII